MYCFLEEMEFSELIEKTFLNFSAFLYFFGYRFCCVVNTSHVVIFTYAISLNNYRCCEAGTMPYTYSLTVPSRMSCTQ